MTRAQNESSTELEPHRSSSPAAASPGEIWLDGGVLACACPECGAPMSIRLWLGLADCWRCGTSIELTDEQEEQARRLMQRWQSRGEEEFQQAAAITPTMRRTPRARVDGHPQAQPHPATTTPRRARSESRWSHPVGEDTWSAKPVTRSAFLRHALLPGRWRGLGDAMLTNLPAWLVSLIVHLIAILLLGLINIGIDRPSPAITLSTSINYRDTPGEEGLLAERFEETLEFEEAGVVTPLDLTEELAPGEVEIDISGLATPAPTIPTEDLTLEQPVETLNPGEIGHMFSGRDPSVRSRLLEEQGGTTATEAAVARGLRWLARHQNADGSWSLDAFHKAPGATGDEDGLGQHSDTAGTGLALLPFLGAGQTHARGQYRLVVLRGLNWLVENQKPDGDLRGSGVGDMYAHGIATIVLCEAYALTRDQQLREPAQKAVDFIVRAQHPAGGWRYDPGQAGDTSVLGWQLMALRSAKMAYLRVSDEPLVKAAEYLDTAQTDKYGGKYSYMPGGPETPTMTAEALLCRQYLGWPRHHRGLKVGAYFLLNHHLPSAKELDRSEPWFYYIYYGTQVMHHMGGDMWQRWNRAMQETLLATQRTDGSLAGSWDPVERFGHQGGRIYTTALAICTLEVYYRHMPLYESSSAIFLRDREPETTPTPTSAGPQSR